MVDKYKVITLCGSTRFKEQFLEAQKRLTLEGINCKGRGTSCPDQLAKALKAL